MKLSLFLALVATSSADAFVAPTFGQTQHRSTTNLAAFSPNHQNENKVSMAENVLMSNVQKIASSLLLCGTLCVGAPLMAFAGEGAEVAANAKITTGGASTLQSGRTIAITRGVNLDRSDFGGQNLKGVAFQQSIVRDTNFKGTNLYGASFFDATLDGSNFEDADLSLANVEMAQFNRANLKNAVLKEMYVSGSTLFEGLASIENTDWSDTMLRKDQQKYLCNHPTAKGTNPVTGMDTRESLMCPE
mmetsp:Transcript_10390/g.14581  ORF Transcript_10390/g.14581 Transcript_10390/m.14581 type:complete len:246 (+) Transcript_10390:159-896(+)